MKMNKKTGLLILSVLLGALTALVDSALLDYKIDKQLKKKK